MIEGIKGNSSANNESFRKKITPAILVGAGILSIAGGAYDGFHNAGPEYDRHVQKTHETYPLYSRDEIEPAINIVSSFREQSERLARSGEIASLPSKVNEKEIVAAFGKVDRQASNIVAINAANLSGQRSLLGARVAGDILVVIGGLVSTFWGAMINTLRGKRKWQIRKERLSYV